MFTYSNRLQPALQNLLRVVRFFHRRSSCTTTHKSADVQRITLNASCMTILGGRTKQLYTFCRVTGFTSDFFSFIVVEHIRFFRGAIQLHVLQRMWSCRWPHGQSGTCITDTAVSSWKFKQYWNSLVVSRCIIPWSFQSSPNQRKRACLPTCLLTYSWVV